MALERVDDEQLQSEIAQLSELTLDELKALFLALTGRPLPKYMRRGLMTQAVAHAMREAASGGLARDTQRQLDALVRQIVPTGEPKPAPLNRKIKAGTRLLREWQGRVHEVTVVQGGFSYRGSRYRSLSEIARTITGTRWNGWVFFGLKKTSGPAAASPLPSAKRRGPPARQGPRERRALARGSAGEEGARHA